MKNTQEGFKFLGLRLPGWVLVLVISAMATMVNHDFTYNAAQGAETRIIDEITTVSTSSSELVLEKGKTKNGILYVMVSKIDVADGCIGNYTRALRQYEEIGSYLSDEFSQKCLNSQVEELLKAADGGLVLLALFSAKNKTIELQGEATAAEIDILYARVGGWFKTYELPTLQAKLPEENKK